MHRTYRLGSERRALYVSCYVVAVVLLLALTLCGARLPHRSWIGLHVAALLTVAGLTLLTLDLTFTRVVATPEGIESYDCLGRLKFTLTYSEITEYRHVARNEWRLVARETEHKLPSIEFGDFHRLMVSHARKALRAMLWKTGQVPPPSDVHIPCLLDVQFWLAGMIAAGIGAAALWLILKTAGTFAAVSPYIWGRVYDLKDAPGKLSLTADSITATWPWRRRSIGWSEVRAVFRVQERGARCFVVTSERESIFIPPHVASDLEVMRKFFYSIPSRTPCVNFDETVGKGYRRRRRRASQKTDLALELQFRSPSTPV